MRVRDLMTAAPITVTPETSVVDARHLMATSKIRHLLVTDGPRLVGIVTEYDFLVIAGQLLEEELKG